MHFDHLPNDRVTLSEFIHEFCCGMVALTRVSAKAFGIPYPLQTGWLRKYGDRTAMLHSLTIGPVTAKIIEERIDGVIHEPRQAKKQRNLIEPRGGFCPMCACDALPWEDCEHTENAAALAMREMLEGTP